MRIAIIGAGNMGSWMVESLCLDYEVGVYDVDRSKLKYFSINFIKFKQRSIIPCKLKLWPR